LRGNDERPCGSRGARLDRTATQGRPASYRKALRFLVTAAQKVECKGRFSLARSGVRGLRFRFVQATPRVIPPPAGSCRLACRTDQEIRDRGVGYGAESLKRKRKASCGKSGKRPWRQHLPRAPQPNCALFCDRMSDSRRSINLRPRRLTTIESRNDRSAAWPGTTPANSAGRNPASIPNSAHAKRPPRLWGEKLYQSGSREDRNTPRDRQAGMQPSGTHKENHSAFRFGMQVAGQSPKATSLRRLRRHQISF
jgi:hypothetical protein